MLADAGSDRHRGLVERWPFLSFTVWADGDPGAINLLRTAIREADPQQPILRLRSYDELLSSAMAGRRFNTLLVALLPARSALRIAETGSLSQSS